jgi:hypothetical protein
MGFLGGVHRFRLGLYRVKLGGLPGGLKHDLVRELVRRGAVL